jgi:D-alanyl-D-alanine carboxypeptidase
MIYLITNLILIALFFNIGAVQLHDSSQIIVNPTMPEEIEDIVINQEEGGDISREVIYPTKKESAENEPQINAASALTIDAESGLVLFDKNSKAKMPIASITKLMTALVFLDQQWQQGDTLDWDSVVKFSRDDFREGRRYLGVGEKVTIKDLFAEMLIGSANSGTVALVHSTGLSDEEFVQKMNEKAHELKMMDSNFSDPTGLDADNISTARDLAKLVYVAMQKTDITELLVLPTYEIIPSNKKVKHKITNTNWLIRNSWLEENNYQLIGGKTGYTNEAGFSFVSQIANADGNKIISVLLKTNTVNNRFDETKKIVKWSFDNYNFGESQSN